MHNNEDEELEPIVAAGNPFAGGNSRLERSLRARRQLRDRKGRFIYMGGGLSSIFRMPNGSLVNTIGRSVGASGQEGFAQLMVENSSEGVDAGVYDVPAGNSQVAQAILPGSASTVPYTGPASSADIVDFDSLTRRDAPDGWTKNDDGSFTTLDGEFTAAPTADGKYSLSQNDENIGEFRDAATAITRATAIDAEDTADEETKKRVATLRERGSDQIAIDRAIFNAPEFQVGEDADDFFYEEAPTGAKVKTSFKYGDFEDNVNLIGTKQEDGTWKFERNPNEPWNESFNGFEDTYTPEQVVNQFESTEITELPEQEAVATIGGRQSDDVRAELNDAKERFEALEAELDSTEDADRQGELVDEMTALNEEIGSLEDEYNKARLAELPQEPAGQEAQDTVQSLTRRIDRLERDIERRIDRGEPTDKQEQEIDDLEQKRQALIDAGEEDGGAEAERGAEGNVPDELVGDDARSPRVERRGDTLRDSSGNVIASKVSEPLNAEEIRERGLGVAELFEVTPENANVFRDALLDASKDHPFGASVTIHDEDYYKQDGVRLFLTQDGKGGIALNGDEIVSGFMAPDAVDSNSGAVLSMVDKMVELGGRRLDAFDTILPKLYARAGFKPVARLKWNDEYAPTVEGGAARDWDKAQYERFNGGEPDVVFMAYDPERRWSEYNPEEGEYVNEYDEGTAAQESAVQPQTEEVVTQDLTERQKAAQARRQAAQEANDALAGGDGLLEGEVPSNARGAVSNQSLQLAPIGQVVEATSRNGRNRRFIKVGKDTWKRTDKPEDKKRYRSYELRGGTASYVPRTESDIPSVDEVRGPVDRYRPKPFAFPRGATEEELTRLRDIYQNQADTDNNVGGSLRAAETVRLIDMNLARRRGESVARLRPAAQRRLEDQRAGRPTEPAGVRAPRRAPRGNAPLLPNNAPGAGTNPEAYTPSGDTPEGTTDDPQELAQIFDLESLRSAYATALIGNEDSIRLQFPGENGQPGPEANVPIDAVRDTMQILGFDTNTLIPRREVEMPPAGTPFEELPADAEAPAIVPERTVPDFELGRHQSAAQELAHAYNSLRQYDSDYARTFTNDPNDPRLQAIASRRAALVRRIRTLEAEGFRNTYQIQDVNLDNFKWDGNTPDIYNPELIMDALKAKYPDAETLPNGDLKIGENFVEVGGNRFKYEAIITKTDDETFYTYIRETNLAEQDPAKAVRSIRFGEMRQSARAVNNQATKALNKIYNNARGASVHSWFNDRRRGREGRPPRFDLPDENGAPVHVKDSVFTREAIRKITEAVNDDQITEEMIGTLYNYIKNFGNDTEVLSNIYDAFGLDVPTMNRFIDAVNENINDRDNLSRFRLWESDNGTPLAEGDEVTYIGDENQRGFERLNGRRGIVRIRALEHTSNGYTYTDYAYMELLDENGRPTNEEYVLVSSHNLRLDKTSGGTDGSERMGPNAISMPLPVLTTRAGNRYAGQGRLGSIAPYVTEYNREDLASPKITIDGVEYPVQASRGSSSAASMEKIAPTPSELAVGDFIRTFEDENGYQTARLNEVVGIEEREDGSRLVHMVMPVNLTSARVSSIEYPAGVTTQLDVFRESPVDPDTNAPAGEITNNHLARLAEVMRGVDTSQLNADTLTRIREILSSTDPASLPYTQRQFADIFTEALQAQRRGIAGSVTPEEASRVMENMIRYAEPTSDAASGVESVRRAGLQRSGQLRPRPAATYRPQTPRRASNVRTSPTNMDLGNLQRGPFTNNEGASTIGADAFKEALRNGDQATLEREIKQYVGGKVFGTKFALDNVQVSANRGQVSWSANIVDPATGRIAGTTSRYYFLEDDKLIVKHSSIFINGQSDKGTGFATEYKKVSDNFYKSIGVDKIKIQTVQDGSYAWGKANYTWSSASDARSVRHQVERQFARAQQRNDLDNAEILKNMLDRFDKPFNDADFPDPIDIANLQKADGTPWGREIMTNSGWFGVRYLNPNLDPRPKNRQDKGKVEAPAEAPAEAPEGGMILSADAVKEALASRNREVLDKAFTEGLFGNGEKQFGNFFVKFTKSFTETYGDGQPRYIVEADVLDADGKRVGSMVRVVRLNQDGDLRVVHSYLEIRGAENKNTGFSTQFSAASEEFYQRLGVSEIALDSAWDGSYVWAKAGYDFNFKDYSKRTAIGAIPENLADALENALNSGRMQDAEKLNDLIERFDLEKDDPNFPTPFEIASLVSEDPGMTSWARKLLTDTEWHGIKRLGKYGRTGEERARDLENPSEASSDVYTDEEGEAV